MKDISILLSQSAPKPQRELPGNFTTKTIAEIKSRPAPSRLHTAWLGIKLHPVKRSAALAFAVVVIASGTATAIALWPAPSVKPMTTMSLPNGNHVVGYDAKNCNYFDELSGRSIQPTDDVVYYEVRQGTSLTDQELQSSLQAVCEENISDAAIGTIYKQLPQTAGLETTGAYTVNAITASSITLTLDSHYSAGQHTLQPHLTYMRFASDAKVYDESSLIAYSDLKVGDTVKLVIQDTSSIPAESSQNYVAMNHPEAVIIRAIMKLPQLTGDPDTFYSTVGTYLVRLQPCASSPNGLCRAYNFMAR